MTTVDEAEQEAKKQQFRLSAEPLAKFLATCHVNDPIHEGLTADLYDLVNEVRDARIKKAKELITRFKSATDFYYCPQKRTTVLNLQRIIRSLQGVSENVHDEDAVCGSVQAESAS